jgi:hypothetical protein
MSVSVALARFYALAVAEEVASEMRHDAVNGFGGLAAMAYQLWRRVTIAHPPLGEDAAIVGTYKGFSSHVSAAAERLEVRFLPPTAPPAAIDVERVVRATAEAAGSAVEVTVEGVLEPVAIDELELAAIVFGLLDPSGDVAANTVTLAPGAGTVVVTAAPYGAAVVDAPPLGVRVAQRLAAAAGDTALARLQLPTVIATNAVR